MTLGLIFRMVLIPSRETVARKYFALFLFALLLLLVRPADAVIVGQIDDFQDGTTANWTNGAIIGITPVTNIATGGPAGAGDRFIQITSDGSGPGGRLTVFNRDQWLGDYVSGGIKAVEVDLRNQGAVNLSIRLAFKNGPGNGVPGYLSQVMSLPDRRRLATFHHITRGGEPDTGRKSLCMESVLHR